MPLGQQDRSLWDSALITEGVAILQAALARDRLGEYQAQAAVAALHADARTAEETDWVQIVGWYDELLRLTDSPVVPLNRAVAVGEADGPRQDWLPWPRSTGRRATAHRSRRLPARAGRGRGHRRTPLRRRGRQASNLQEREHLTRQAARLNTDRG